VPDVETPARGEWALTEVDARDHRVHAVDAWVLGFAAGGHGAFSDAVSSGASDAPKPFAKSFC
jgi:hypothetical protein